MPRSSIGTLPPIISGPIYWGNNSWYFYPWGYGAMGLGYLWDPWLWSGYGYYGGGYPYWGDTWAGSGYGYGYGNYGGSGGYSASSSIQGPEATGGLRLGRASVRRQRHSRCCSSGGRCRSRFPGAGRNAPPRTARDVERL